MKLEENIVSQFMICKSKYNLEKYGRKLIGLQNINIDLCHLVLEKYYPDVETCDVWIIEKIHNLCDEVLDYEKFIVSELYQVLNNVYDLCEWIIMWYGGEYDDLEEIYSKEDFIDYVKCCVEVPCCEMYVRVCIK